MEVSFFCRMLAALAKRGRGQAIRDLLGDWEKWLFPELSTSGAPKWLVEG